MLGLANTCYCRWTASALYFFPQLQDMVTGQITNFEVLETAKNFSNLYSTVYPGIMQVPSFGGIICIYTKNGIG